MPDFKKQVNSVKWYDLRYDWDLIEASFAKQYGIRIRENTAMPWTEFCTLVGGLMPDTPLGQVVGIRSESNKDVIKGFAQDQRRIMREWKEFLASEKSEDPDKLDKDLNALMGMFKKMFSKKK